MNKVITTNDELIVQFNKIFRTNDFKMFAVSKLKFLPADVTISTSAVPGYDFYCVVKHYGYYSTLNDGTEGTDLSDYSTETVTPDIMEVCVEYLKLNYPDLYEIVNNNIIC